MLHTDEGAKRRQAQIERNERALAAIKGTDDFISVSVVYSPSQAGGEPERWFVVSFPATHAQAWDRLQEELRRAATCGVHLPQSVQVELNRFWCAAQGPSGAPARRAFGLAGQIDARHVVLSHERKCWQIGLALLALAAGWKFRPLTLQRLRHPLRMAAPALGLSHCPTFH